MTDNEETMQRAVKAKNLLSCITALAFGEKDEDVSQAVLRAETTHIQHMLREHQVFRYVHNGNALNKFYSSMIQQTKDSNPLQQVAAMEYLAIAVEGSLAENLEARVPKLLDVVFHALKHQTVPVTVPALHILTHLIHNIDQTSVDTRRAIVDQISRLVPTILLHIGDVSLTGGTAAFFTAAFDVLHAGCTRLSTTFRPFANKIELASLVLLNPPLDNDTAVLSVLPALSQCFGAIANATPADATSSTWQQVTYYVLSLSCLTTRL